MHRRHSTCIDKIRTIHSSHACDSNNFASRSPSSVAQFQRLPCQACCRACGQIFFLGMMQKRVGRRRFGSQIARIGDGDSQRGDIGADILRLERSLEADMHCHDGIVLAAARNRCARSGMDRSQDRIVRRKVILLCPKTGRPLPQTRRAGADRHSNGVTDGFVGAARSVKGRAWPSGSRSRSADWPCRPTISSPGRRTSRWLSG